MRALQHLAIGAALMALGFSDPATDVSAEDYLERSPFLEAEHCFKTRPVRVISELTAAGWFDCQTCLDGALALYADRVRPLVNVRCAGVTPARATIHEVLVQFDRAFQSVTDGNWFGHELSRHAASVEWILITLESEKGGLMDAPRYAHSDLRAVMLLWYRAHRTPEPVEPQPIKTEFAQFVDTALAALEHAEHQLSADQGAHLRQLVMKRLARWL